MLWTSLLVGISISRNIDGRQRNTLIARSRWYSLGAFSPLQTLNPNNEKKAMKLAEGVRHMEFVAKLYRKQIEGDRIFVHENPAHAKSWALPCIRRVAREMGVDIVEADQCMFGLRTWGSSKAQLVLAKKPTKFLSLIHISEPTRRP